MRWHAATFVPAMLAAGCVAHLPYQRPEVRLPSRWSGAAVSGSAALASAAPWWHGFADPELEGLIGRATRGSLDLRVAVDRMLVAREMVKVARAARWPQVGLNGYPIDPATTTVNRGRSELDSSPFELSLGASYELDLWGRIQSAAAASAASYQASRFDAGAAEIALLGSVARAHFEIRRLDEAASIEGRRVALASERVRRSRLRQAAGRTGAAPVTEAELAAREAEARLSALGRERRLAVAALAALIGETPESLVIPAAPLRAAVTAPVPPEGLPASLLERRPDVRAAESRLIAAHAEVAVARTQFFPQVTLTAKFGFVTDVLRNIVKSANPIFGVGPEFAYPIFDGGRRDAELAASERREDAFVAEYRKAVLNAFVDVERALVGYQAAVEADARNAEVRSADQAQIERLRAAVSAGRANPIELLAAEENALARESVALRSYRERLDALIALYEALGGGWSSADLPVPAEPGGGSHAARAPPPIGLTVNVSRDLRRHRPDNLTLNILMLLYPMQSIRTWQSRG